MVYKIMHSKVNKYSKPFLILSSVNRTRSSHRTVTGNISYCFFLQFPTLKLLIEEIHLGSSRKSVDVYNKQRNASRWSYFRSRLHKALLKRNHERVCWLFYLTLFDVFLDISCLRVKMPSVNKTWTNSSYLSLLLQD